MKGEHRTKAVKIDIDDISQKSWSYGMQKMAKQIIAQAYGAIPDAIVFTSVDLKRLVFQGYNAMDWNKKFALQLKITPRLKEKIYGSNQKDNN